MKILWVFGIVFSSLVHAGPIAISQVGGFLHGNGGLISEFDDASPNHFTTLNADNLGSFGWTFTNTSGVAINDALFLLFLDADIDRDLNTFFNEYGTFVSLALPVGAPPGATSASSWEIDEPGFVFGDIFNNLLLGALDNTNAVPSSTPDDVSLALGFLIGTLGPGQTLTAMGTIGITNIGGLSQTDPASNYTLFLNGYATLDQSASEVPEPSMKWSLLLLAAAFAAKQSIRTRS